ncbi:MAG TPA: sugar phosphate isomerase/epimerase [Acidobacteriaceae bacterium]|jgi:sugar phosphate isomerase/epimerase|nr:sugar phosphate isomerase/epimerase [Acidobacteriaceae bacterium]
MTITRRTLLRTAALTAAVAPLTPTRTLAQAPTQEKIRLGLASYTFRNFSRAQLIAFMRDLQVFDLNAKDAKDHLPMDPAGEAQALADYRAAGIRLHAAGAIYFQKATDDDIRAQFEYLKRANIPVMVAGDPSPDTLPRIEQFVKRYNIRLAIHNHGPEDKLWPSPLDILKDIRTMDPRIGCCIDVGHTVRAGTDVVEAIHAVGPRLFNMHMKDLTDFHDKASQVAVGDGKMPVPEIFGALQKIRYTGFVDLEYEVHPDDPMPGVTRSFAYMRGVLAGMNAPRSS